MSEVNTYNHLDIQRYLANEMTEMEMHAFEKAMHDDPFLADAMEGYANSNNTHTQQHLSAIHTKIAGEKQDTKVVAMPAYKSQWWKIAVIIIVVASAGIATYQLSLTGSPAAGKKIAILQNQQPMVRDSIGPVNPAPQANSNLSDNTIVKSQSGSPVVNEREANGLVAMAPMLLTDSNSATAMAQADVATNAATMEVKESISASQATLQKEDETVSRKTLMAKALPLREYRGRIKDKAGDPLPFASVSVTNNNVATVADANGYFTFKAADTVVEVRVSSAGFATATSKVSSLSKENSITLSEDNASLSEVVVTGLSKRKQADVAAMSPDETAAQPIGGWNKFRKYVDREISQFMDSASINTDDDIAIDLEFKLDNIGRPIHITVSNTADAAFSNKAIDIIKKGPRWKSKKPHTNIKVTIPF